MQVDGLCNGTGEDDFKFTADCKTPELIWVRSRLSAREASQSEALNSGGLLLSE